MREQIRKTKALTSIYDAVRTVLLLCQLSKLGVDFADIFQKSKQKFPQLFSKRCRMVPEKAFAAGLLIYHQPHAVRRKQRIQIIPGNAQSTIRGTSCWGCPQLLPRCITNRAIMWHQECRQSSPVEAFFGRVKGERLKCAGGRSSIGGAAVERPAGAEMRGKFEQNLVYPVGGLKIPAGLQNREETMNGIKKNIYETIKRSSQ